MNEQGILLWDVSLEIGSLSKKWFQSFDADSRRRRPSKSTSAMTDAHDRPIIDYAHNDSHEI